ncbi:MAG: putative phosphodiesterase [Marmoricola sp.]|nr:putative phosphodiesterase [Marmoricola sp.]
MVRLSRAVGLPPPVPDIHGLALRVRTEHGVGDLLLASTGWGRLSRFVLTLGRQPDSRPLTTLLPYRTEAGAVLLGAKAVGPRSYELSWAPYDGGWVAFATLELTDRPTDEDISFDPVLNQVPGLSQYPTVVRLRERAYLRARGSRRARSSV